MALTYENDERFAKNINKNRNDHLNQYIARAIRAYIKKVFSIFYCVMIIVNHI